MVLGMWGWGSRKTPAKQALTKTAVTACIPWASKLTKIDFGWGFASDSSERALQWCEGAATPF